MKYIRRTLQITLRVLLTPVSLLPCVFFLLVGWVFLFPVSLLNFAIEGNLMFKEVIVDMYWGTATWFLKTLWGLEL